MIRKRIEENTLIYVILLVAGIISCVIRYPDFDTTLWSASDTNYQCLMNAKAMLEADEGTLSFLPLITFSEDTDYGLEYSSGAFDRKTGNYFYYVSFPAFPFTALTLFLKLTGLAVNETSLYLFCSILFCISLLATVKLFLTIFDNKAPDGVDQCMAERIGLCGGMDKRFVAFVTGITYLCSVEIMHSQGLTYWGQNWYMIFFPMLCTLFLKIERTEKPTWKAYSAFLILGLLLLQTEWSGYFALFAFWLVSLFRLVKRREKKYFCLVVGMAVETVVSAAVFVLVNEWVVGFSEFINVITARAEYRSRTTEYSFFAVEKALHYSFGSVLLLLVFYASWMFLHTIICRQCANKKAVWKKESISIIVLFLIPLTENHVFTEHALRYSMDRMKWYFILNFLLLLVLSKLLKIRCSKIIICYSLLFIMAGSLLAYLFVANNYRWQDKRLYASIELEQYIETQYSDNVLGQLGNENVWGYSKILFGHGIIEKTCINTLIERAEKFHKRYAVALNDLEMSYTQKWYSSAVIYDSVMKKYNIAGSLHNSYMDKIDDLAYLESADYIDLYLGGYDNFLQRISFTDNSTLRDKKETVSDYINQYDQGEELIYFTSEAKTIPCLVTVFKLDWGEWTSGVSATGNRLIFLNSEGNREVLTNAKTFTCGETTAMIRNVLTEENYIFVDLDTNKILDFSYPNAIIVGYEEKLK